MEINKKIQPFNKIYILSLILLIVVVLTYWNHFDNDFHFDDFHTIVNNVYIRSLKNIPLFFTDVQTYSSQPSNQIYRPIVTTSIAIDYWLAGGLKPVYFHFSMFLTFILQGIIMFLMYKIIIHRTLDSAHGALIALAILTWYMIHPVNAETLNYILARSDLLSTFFTVLAFYLFARGGRSRKFYLYIIPLILGILTKRTSIMFLPIMVIYVVLFETDYPIYKAHLSFINRKFRNLNFHYGITALVCLVGYLLTNSKTVVPFGVSVENNYLITQPYVILHYFTMLFLPLELSADTDWVVLDSTSDPRFIQGIVFILGILFAIVLCSTKKNLKPICFGLSWFLFALIPTSSIIPMAEVMNDHRMYFPFVGLVLAIGWALFLIINYLNEKVTFFKVNKRFIIAGYISFMGLYAYGTYQRNEVWHDEESLWKDVTIKSPLNGRGLVSYGAALIKNGKIEDALVSLRKAEEHMSGNSNLMVNIAIAMEHSQEYGQAEHYYIKAKDLDPKNVSSRFFYAKFLNKRNRNEEALIELEKSIELVPAHLDSRHLLMVILFQMEKYSELDQLTQETLTIAPGDKLSNAYLAKLNDVLLPLEK